MTFNDSIQTPVTASDYAGDQRDSLRALAQFYQALNSRDLELMQQNWANSAEAAMDNPLGGIKRGWNEIRTTYERLFASKGAYQFEFYDYTLKCLITAALTSSSNVRQSSLTPSRATPNGFVRGHPRPTRRPDPPPARAVLYFHKSSCTR